MVDAEAVEADVDALDNPARGEVEVVAVIPAELGPEDVGVARHVAEGDAEEAFAHSPPVEGGRVDEVHPQVERHADRPERLADVDLAELLPERRRAEAEEGQVEASLSQRSRRHWPGFTH